LSPELENHLGDSGGKYTLAKNNPVWKITLARDIYSSTCRNVKSGI